MKDNNTREYTTFYRIKKKEREEIARRLCPKSKPAEWIGSAAPGTKNLLAVVCFLLLVITVLLIIIVSRSPQNGGSDTDSSSVISEAETEYDENTDTSSQSDTDTEYGVKVTSIKFAEETISIAVGESVPLNIITEPSDAKDKTFKIKSNDDKIVKVTEEGKLKGIAAGSTTVTATLKSAPTINATLVVNVIDEAENDLLDDYLAAIPTVKMTGDSVFPTQMLTGKAITDIDGDGASELLLRFNLNKNVEVIHMIKVEDEKCVCYKTYNNITDLYPYSEGEGSYSSSILVHYTTGNVCMEYKGVIARSGSSTKTTEEKIYTPESGGYLGELVGFKSTTEVVKRKSGDDDNTSSVDENKNEDDGDEPYTPAETTETKTKYYVNDTKVEQSTYEEIITRYAATYTVWNAWESVE